MRHKKNSERGRFGRHATAGAVTVLATGLVGSAVFGVGAFSHLDQLSDGSSWLWSRVTGEVIRVNANNGQVDLVQAVKGSANHPVRLAQNNRHLVLHDLNTGSLTSVNLSRMDFSGETEIGASTDNHFILGRDAAVIVAKETGEIRRVDPETLQPVGEPLQLAGPLVGGQFDSDGVLWVAAPSQGTVVGIDPSGDQPQVVDSVPVSDPGDDIALTVLDSGALAVNRDSGELSVVSGGSATTVDSPVSLKGAEVPDRTAGDLATVTVADSSSIVAVRDLTGDPQPQAFTVHGERPDPALAYSGQVYVPYSGEGLVRKFSRDGTQSSTIQVPDAGKSPLELEVRENHLFINAPESESALVIDPDGLVRKVSKYDTDPEGDGSGDGQGGEGGSDQRDNSGEPYVDGPDQSDYVPDQTDLPDASTPEDLPKPPPGPNKDGKNGKDDRRHPLNGDDNPHDDQGRPEDHEDGYEPPPLPDGQPELPELPETPEGPGNGWGGDDDGPGGGDGKDDDGGNGWPGGDEDGGIIDWPDTPGNNGDGNQDDEDDDQENDAPGLPGGLPDPPDEDEDDESENDGDQDQDQGNPDDGENGGPDDGEGDPGQGEGDPGQDDGPETEPETPPGDGEGDGTPDPGGTPPDQGQPPEEGTEPPPNEGTQPPPPGPQPDPGTQPDPGQEPPIEQPETPEPNPGTEQPPETPAA
ncbi:hypothetical protein GCM10027570_37480 [Streptomonospora sediminis]